MGSEFLKQEMGVAPSWFWDGIAGLLTLAAANHFGRALNPEAIKCISKAGFFFYFFWRYFASCCLWKKKSKSFLWELFLISLCLGLIYTLCISIGRQNIYLPA